MTFYSSQKICREPRTIDDLPSEILEFILSLVSPYVELQNCALVCKRWHETVQRVRKIIRVNLNRAILDFCVRWEEIPHGAQLVPTISKRHSHSACCYDNSMYVFGGCTSSCSTFNDLWRLDLTRRVWVRPLTMGTYPSPKACASLVCYKGSLVLFGGWSHPSPYPLHQAWRLFNELHVYCITSNRWTCINTVQCPPAVAGHSATIHSSTMVIFGGLQKKSSLEQFNRSNDIWCFDFNESPNWRLQPTTEPRPAPRYGQSQIWLSDRHMLVIGGCGGASVVYSDVWLLDMGAEIPDAKATWVWTKLEVLGTQNAPAHLWCHPACKVGQCVVTFARSPDSCAPMMPYKSWKLGSQVWVPPRECDLSAGQQPAAKKGPASVDQNVNGRRGTLNRRAASSSSEESDVELPSSSRASISGLQHRPGVSVLVRNTAQPSVKPNAMRNRARQLEMLRRMEERIKSLHPIPPPPPPPPQHLPPRNAMTMFVMDISEVLTHGRVTWLPLKPSIGPEETILYSLVPGIGELIMFGGIEKDAMSLLNCSHEVRGIVNTVCNNLRFISAPREII